MLFIGGVVSISYKVELFCVSFFLYFLLSMFTLYWVVFVNMWPKGGEIVVMWESYLFCLGGVEIVYDSVKYKYVWQIKVCFDVSNLGGELVCIFVICFICFLFHIDYWFIFMIYSWYISLFCVMWNQEVIFVLLVFSTYAFMYLLSVSKNIQVDSAVLLSTLATDR